MKIHISLAILILFVVVSICQGQDRPEDSIQVEVGRTADQYYNIGNWYAERNQYFKAIAYYKAALTQDPDMCNALINMGLAYKNVKRFEDAIAAYQRALGSGCQQDFIHLNLGNTYVSANQLAQALPHFDAFIQKQQYDPDGYLNKGITLYKLKKYKDAASTFEKLILLESDNAYFVFQTARCYAKLQNHQKTADKILAAYTIDPNIRYALMDDPDFKEFRSSDEFKKIREQLMSGQDQE